MLGDECRHHRRVETARVGDASSPTQRHLLQEVWGPQYEHETNYLRVHLAAIRKKLEPTPARPRYFVTEPGIGYRFEPDADVKANDN